MMNRNYLIISLSSLALLVVFLIQLNWIFQTAKIKEELFSEKANMVLSKTAEALSVDSATLDKLVINTSNKDVKKIDSLFNSYMKQYNIHIGYYFEVTPDLSADKNPPGYTNIQLPYTANCFKQCVKEKGGKNGIQLKLVFPAKDQFILEEMGVPFITSVLLILVVGVLFWRTTASLLKEKQISEHTREFLNNMTHEFKTPLTNIALAGNMLGKENVLKQEDKIKQYTGIILHENDKLRQEVEAVLSMSALERNEVPLQKTEIDLHELIRDVVKYMTLQIENKGGQVVLDLKATQFLIMGDRALLSKVFCNLIDNALKYATDKAQLSIHSESSYDTLQIMVADNGIGIEKKFHKRIFDTFFRVPTGDIHDVKGFGLGLAYIKKIMDLHEGSITIESEKGKGSVFTLSFKHV